MKKTTYFCDACARQIHPVELSAKLFFHIDVVTVFAGEGKAESRLHQDICCDCYRKIILVVDSANENATWYLDRDIKQVREIIGEQKPALKLSGVEVDCGETEV